MSITIGKVFDLTVNKYPNKEAIYDVRKNLRYTYKEWKDRVLKVANAMKQEGISKGDRVVTYLFNSEEMATIFFACAKIGAIFVPVNFRLMAEEISYILEDAGPKLVVFERMLESPISAIEHRFPETAFWTIDEKVPSFASSFQEKAISAPTSDIAINLHEDDIYAIMYTSGTTGRPKGVIHHHRDMVEQSLIVISATKLHSNDNGLVVAPMYHCAELHCAFLPRVHVGAKNIIIHHFDAKEVLRVMAEEKVTKLFAAPTMWNMLLQEDISQYDLSNLTLGLYGAAPMAPTLVYACQNRLGIKLVQAYGMTEMGPAIAFLSEDDQIRKAGSAGQACLNHEIRIVRPNESGPSDPEEQMPIDEPGEIIVKGPCVMSGYYNRPDASKQALAGGWYHSGDIGFLDDEGYLWVKDRIDDMIISGGENIYPREIEDVIYEHDGVLDVAIIGSPDEHWGEKVTAFIVRKNQALTEQELDQWLKNHEKLANFKRPRQYIFCDVLPRNASGKIQKYELRKQLEDLLAGEQTS